MQLALVSCDSSAPPEIQKQAVANAGLDGSAGGSLPDPRPANPNSENSSNPNTPLLGPNLTIKNPVVPNSNSNSTGQNDSSSTCYKAEKEICQIEELITQKTNTYRARNSLAPLIHDPKIAFVARDYSEQQRNFAIPHHGFPRMRVAKYLSEFGEQLGSSLSENEANSGRVGASVSSPADIERIAEEFANMWYNSEGHRNNMLARNRKALGSGVYLSSDRQWYATQIFK
jgi:uncharacterized protein YkwD